MLPLGLNILTLAGLAQLALGILFHIIGLATPSWSAYDLLHATAGLFKGCISGDCYTFDESTASNALKACQGFALIGLFAALAGAGLTAYHIGKPSLGKTQNTRIPLYAAIDCGLAFFCICVCAILYADQVKVDGFHLGYSFVLSIVGGIFIVTSGILMYLAARRTVGYGSVP